MANDGHPKPCEAPVDCRVDRPVGENIPPRPWVSGLRVIGLVGGIASGKTLVATLLERLGACRLDADRAGHEVLRSPEVRQAAIERWGPQILDARGEIDRRRVAELVFSPPPDGPRERSFLERLTHPRIGQRLQEEARRRAAEGYRVAVLDAPLLFEAGWVKLCDVLMFVDAPRQLRLARALARGWSEKEFAEREGVQESLESKRKQADWVVDNSGSPEQTRAQLEAFWRRLVG
ncbi:MAG: dephospho-CoA kinase [Thermoguttaceae bacterium]|nr:dephospho-CoA kinase [Thermoguttaceae bacterium]